MECTDNLSLLVNRLFADGTLSRNEFITLIEQRDQNCGVQQRPLQNAPDVPHAKATAQQQRPLENVQQRPLQNAPDVTNAKATAQQQRPLENAQNAQNAPTAQPQLETVRDIIRTEAIARQRTHFGTNIYRRGLIEWTSYCRNNCMYCGIRCGNTAAGRYRLSKTDILACAEKGYNLGFKTFVLQGGEDSALTPQLVADTVETIKKRYPDVAVTLSLGEHPRSVYQLWKQAGADRYLLRHETANPAHYAFLHAQEPQHTQERTAQYRKECLFTLKDLGYQTGSGFMVGSPGQTTETLAQDLLFLKELNPHMIGIGPFIPHKDTPFHNYPSGSVELTLFLLSVLRIMFPTVLLPATTALGTLTADGRLQGILSGANVVMPNLSPATVRPLYNLYNNKLTTGCEAAESVSQLEKQIASIGYNLVTDRGDAPQI